MSKFICTIDFLAKDGQVKNLIAEMLRQKNQTIKEEGCLDYQIFKHTKDANKIFVIETYKSEIEFQKHFETEHVKAFFKESAPIFVANASHETYNVV